MNQEAFFKFSDYVSSSVPPLKLLRNMQIAADYLASKGIGMIHSVSGVGYTMDLDVDMENWFAKGLSNGLQMRVYMQTMDVKKAKKRRLPRIGGCFDAALDGCFGSADAAMLEPYEGSDDCGVLYYTDEQVAAFCKEANRAGLQIELHAIGDAAFRQATYALKAALEDYPVLTTDTPLSMLACLQRRALTFVRNTALRWPFRAPLSIGPTSPIRIWNAFSVTVRLS